MNFSRHSGCGQRSLRCSFSPEFTDADDDDNDDDAEEDDEADADDAAGVATLGGDDDDARMPGDATRSGDVASGVDGFFASCGDGAATSGFGDSASGGRSCWKSSLLATIGVVTGSSDDDSPFFLVDLLAVASELPDVESLLFAVADSDGERVRAASSCACFKLPKPPPPLPPPTTLPLVTGADDDDEPDVSSECFSSRNSVDWLRLGGELAMC